MAGAIGKFFCLLTGRETPSEKIRRERAEAALAAMDQASDRIKTVAENTRIWAESVRKRCTERRAAQAKKAGESAAQVAVTGNGEAHG